MDIKKKVREYLQRQVTDGALDIEDHSSLFESGLVDSLNLVSLLAFLEEEYEIHIGPSEVTYDNLDSLEAIDRFVSEKLGNDV